MLNCHYFQAGQCRSCSLLSLSHQEVIQQKQQRLAELFPKAELLPFAECNQPNHSRIRAKLAISGSVMNPSIGFFDQARTLVPVADCPLHHSLITSWIPSLRRFIEQAQLTPYDPETDRGELKFVVLTASPSHQKLMVQWVLRSKESVDRIRRAWKQVSGEQDCSVAVMSINIQPLRSSQIQGEVDLPVSENTALPVRYGDLEMSYESGGFIQTNYEIASRLYETAGQWLTEIAPTGVLDLYCGSGAFALTAARHGVKSFGIDSSETSIRCARNAATAAGLDATFECLSLQKISPEYGTDLKNKWSFDAVVCNPPRRGLDRPGLELIRRLDVPHIVYSSCDPETLQRDCWRLQDRWEAVRIQGFDMFPFTPHMEALCLLRRSR